MSDYEWEARRTPRTTRPEPWGLYRPRAREVSEFLALEHPREHVGWVLRQHAQVSPERARDGRAKLGTRSPVPPPDPRE